MISSNLRQSTRWRNSGSRASSFKISNHGTATPVTSLPSLVESPVKLACDWKADGNSGVNSHRRVPVRGNRPSTSAGSAWQNQETSESRLVRGNRSIFEHLNVVRFALPVSRWHEQICRSHVVGLILDSEFHVQEPQQVQHSPSTSLVLGRFLYMVDDQDLGRCHMFLQFQT
jgi:hypothetical protein